MRPHLVGIAGPSSSGKTALAHRLARELRGAALVSLDSYYRGMEEIPLEERKKANYDHPDALEWELLCEHLQAASRGLAFEEPVYSFADYARMAETRRVEADGFVIVEGLFVLYWPELRSMLDTKVYVETGADVCFARRLARDVAERGRTPESVREQYDRTVRPSAERFVHPTAKYADLIVSGEEPLEQSVATVVQALRNAKAAGAR